MMDDMNEDRENDEGDKFDHWVGAILEEEATFLHEQAELLRETGSIRIERPAGAITARLSEPSWRPLGLLAWGRRHALSVNAIAANDAGSSSSQGPMAAKPDDEAAVMHEIILTLAMNLAWLEDTWLDATEDPA